ncbi:pediocin PapC-like protein [Lactobacillus sp. ESL0233]|uniref:pediocin PapC-like protein n=1 Tax=Lactobacillus sp. ESL0233 TaxID=2069354 RepID=UPI000EFBB665|nr:pediocin PapC-like protein [Lactobacillus sp. ESL0233]RMC41520.1 pediocin PapC-like protein [Lactobacillus sp. ESL0233]
MKKLIKYLIMSAFTLLLALSIFPSHQVSAEETVYPIRQVSVDRYLRKIKRTKQITSTEYLSLVKNSKQDFIVYFGFKDCPYWRAESRYLKKFIRKTDYPVYYINMEESLNNATTNELNEIDNSLKPYAFIGTPTFAFFHNNKIQNMMIGYPLKVDQLEQLDKPSLSNGTRSFENIGMRISYLPLRALSLTNNNVD